MSEPILSAVTLTELFTTIRPWSTTCSRARQPLLSIAKPGTPEHRTAQRIGCRVGHMMTVHGNAEDGCLFVEVSESLLAVLRQEFQDRRDGMVVFHCEIKDEMLEVWAREVSQILGGRFLARMPTSELPAVIPRCRSTSSTSSTIAQSATGPATTRVPTAGTVATTLSSPPTSCRCTASTMRRASAGGASPSHSCATRAYRRGVHDNAVDALAYVMKPILARRRLTRREQFFRLAWGAVGLTLSAAFAAMVVLWLVTEPGEVDRWIIALLRGG